MEIPPLSFPPPNRPPKLTTQACGKDGCPVTVSMVNSIGSLLRGACITIYWDLATDGVSLCDNDANDRDPVPGYIETSIPVAHGWVHEDQPPAGCQPIPNDVELLWSEGAGYVDLEHTC